MTLLIAIALGVALVAGFMGARWFQQQARKGPAGPTVPLDIACGQPKEFGPFAQPAAGDCKVMIELRGSCAGRVKIGIQGADGTFAPVQETRPGDTPGTWVDEHDPDVPGTFVLSVPRGRKIRVECLAGSAGNKCEGAVTDLATQPERPIGLRRETAPAGCASWTSTRVVNLSETTLSIKVRFLQLCTNTQNHPQPGRIRFYAARRGLLPHMNEDDVPLDPAQPGATPTATLETSLPKGYALEVACNGTNPACKAKVSVVG